MIFENRKQAGQLLVKELKKRKIPRKYSIIVGIPRGGMVVAFEIAKKFSLPLEALVIKKLGAPHNEELAIGAVGVYGEPVLDLWTIRELKIPSDYIEKELIVKKREARVRESFLGTLNAKETFQGKNVVVVDDGLATGQTVKAAAKILEKFGVKSMILAVPCAASSIISQLDGIYDKIVCLAIESNLEAVGQLYKDFRPVSDEEVKKLLATSQ